MASSSCLIRVLCSVCWLSLFTAAGFIRHARVWCGVVVRWSIDHSLAAGGDDFEVLVDRTVTIDASLESVKDLVAIDELTKDILVTIEVAGCAKGDSEFRAT